MTTRFAKASPQTRRSRLVNVSEHRPITYRDVDGWHAGFDVYTNDEWVAHIGQCGPFATEAEARAAIGWQVR